jgi:hypothetical protein
VGCTHFIDDLPHVLSEIKRPIVKILFDPNNHHKELTDFEIACSWDKITRKILSYENGQE